MKRASLFVVALIGALVAGSATLAAAQDFPNKPVKLIVPVAPGGGTDTFARIIAPALGKNLGQPLVIENKPGGGQIIAATAVTGAPPDGYTLLLASVTAYSVNPFLYAKLPYDPVKDFAPIALTGRFPLLLVVPDSLPVKSVAELIAYAKSKPEGLDFGTPGLGSPHQLAMEFFARRVGIKAVHIPYKGAGPALQDMLGGRLPMMFLDVTTALPQIRAGKIRALGIANLERSALLPDVPTLSESGVPGFEASAWQGIAAPANTPAPVVQKLNSEIVRVLADPEVRTRLIEAGIEPIGGTPADFANYQQAELKKWSEVVRSANIKAD